MSRKFRNANYEATLNQTIRLGDALPADHVARFVVDIKLDLSKVYEQHPKVVRQKSCLGCCFTDMPPEYSVRARSRNLPIESIPMRFIAGELHPDHDTIAHFRKSLFKNTNCSTFWAIFRQKISRTDLP